MPAVPEKYDYKESQLHPLLARFVQVQFNAYSKTIRHIPLVGYLIGTEDVKPPVQNRELVPVVWTGWQRS